MLFPSMKWVRGNGDVARGEKASLGVPVICIKKGLAPLAKWRLLFGLTLRVCLFGGHELFLQMGYLV